MNTPKYEHWSSLLSPEAFLWSQAWDRLTYAAAQYLNAELYRLGYIESDGHVALGIPMPIARYPAQPQPSDDAPITLDTDTYWLFKLELIVDRRGFEDSCIAFRTYDVSLKHVSQNERQYNDIIHQRPLSDLRGVLRSRVITNLEPGMEGATSVQAMIQRLLPKITEEQQNLLDDKHQLVSVSPIAFQMPTAPCSSSLLHLVPNAERTQFTTFLCTAYPYTSPFLRNLQKLPEFAPLFTLTQPIKAKAFIFPDAVTDPHKWLCKQIIELVKAIFPSMPPQTSGAMLQGLYDQYYDVLHEHFGIVPSTIMEYTGKDIRKMYRALAQEDDDFGSCMVEAPENMYSFYELNPDRIKLLVVHEAPISEEDSTSSRPIARAMAFQADDKSWWYSRIYAAYPRDKHGSTAKHAFIARGVRSLFDAKSAEEVPRFTGFTCDPDEPLPCLDWGGWELGPDRTLTLCETGTEASYLGNVPSWGGDPMYRICESCEDRWNYHRRVHVDEEDCPYCGGSFGSQVSYDLNGYEFDHDDEDTFYVLRGETYSVYNRFVVWSEEEGQYLDKRWGDVQYSTWENDWFSRDTVVWVNVLDDADIRLEKSIPNDAIRLTDGTFVEAEDLDELIERYPNHYFSIEEKSRRAKEEEEAALVEAEVTTIPDPEQHDSNDSL